MKRYLRIIVDFIRGVLFDKNEISSFKLIIYTKTDSPQIAAKGEIVLERLKSFCPDLQIVLTNRLSLSNYLNFTLVGVLSRDNISDRYFRIKINEFFDFDYENNYTDGWEYHRLLSKIYHKELDNGISMGQLRLRELTNELKHEFSKSYIFGTGPSLAHATEKDWGDGVRIVSNTIVKDQHIWLHIKPHVLVAGDAIYHFGYSQFAKNFRADLRKCFALTNTYFIFPAQFYHFCLKEFPDFEHRLIPIPQGKSTYFHFDLNTKYFLPALGNVLPLLLLPSACTFSKKIGMWGFDGRAPTDKLFWKNSEKQFYSEYVSELMQMHPAFFNTLVPSDKPNTYVKMVFGKQIEDSFLKAENNGFIFEMMHFSYTESLNKRYENK